MNSKKTESFWLVDGLLGRFNGVLVWCLKMLGEVMNAGVVLGIVGGFLL